MDAIHIPFQKIPHTSALSLDYRCQFSRVASFYRHDPYSPASFRAAADGIELGKDHRVQLADVLAGQNHLFGAGERCRENIERLRHPETVAVVSGQQVGLFGGPSFSVYKALTAIHLARKLSAEGTPAVPVFWMASYDHDFAEVRHTTLLGADFQLRRLSDGADPRKDIPVGDVVFGGDIESLRKEVIALWPADTGEEAEQLLGGYREGTSYAEAFGRLFQQLFAGQGLIVLDPRDARLQRLAQPLYSRVLSECGDLVEKLQERNLTIGHAGYHAQVAVPDNSTLLFVTHKGRRRTLQRSGDGFHLPGKGECSSAHIREELGEAPERFSPSALLRPVVQDWLLPTVAYVGGPAEVAYFAQSSLLYDRLLGRMPVVVPRVSLTLLEPKVERILRKYGLTVCDAFTAHARLQARVAERRLPRRLQGRLDRTDKKIEQLLGDTLTAVNELDPTLAGAVETSRRKMLYQYNKIRGKVARAQAERTGIVERHAALLHNSLYPHRTLQERQVNFLSFVARFGRSLVPQLLERDDLLSRDHLVVPL